MWKDLENINDGLDLPIRLSFCFKKLFAKYEEHANSNNPLLAERAQKILAIKEQCPELVGGFEELNILKKYNSEISQILEDTFTTVLSDNEIKAATVPFQNLVFNPSNRFNKIIENAGPDFKLQIRNMPEDHLYILGCSIILRGHYNVDVEYKRPLFFDIPDKNGIIKNYRILYNADFTEIIPTEKAIPLTDADIKELLENFNNIELWKEKFPPHSYISSGFVISNMFDVTSDEAISSLKSSLLASKNSHHDENFIRNFEGIFQSLFHIPDLKVGFTIYDNTEDVFEAVPSKGMSSFILMDKDRMECGESLCGHSYQCLLSNREYLSMPNIEKFYKMNNEGMPFKTLYEAGYRSAIFAPIANGDEVLGILELVSPKPYALHSVNANKLADVMPFLLAAVMRSKEEEKNEVDAIIQKEFTAIHQSVSWKFIKEAKRYLRGTLRGNETTLNEIVFDDVYPLYGQIDIRRSSEARNNAIIKDLGAQLELLLELFGAVAKEEGLPIYDEIVFRLRNYLKEIKEEYRTNSEETITDFFNEDIRPLLDHVKTLTATLKAMVVNYELSVSNEEGIYHYRKDYDNSVRIINKEMAEMLDKNQIKAQGMFPHLFERYKTDGVEHNMYIGASISQSRKFSQVYLQNLRLWQLQIMCDMENAFYQLQSTLSVKLDVASLVLVHSGTLSIRFRMDEHKFDVDGTYNARYEIIKKRLDKAYIKGTTERITQAGKLTIVYSQRKDETEYLRYIKLLQTQKHITSEVEHLEIEPLQGVSGLKALRVSLLYAKERNSERVFTHNEIRKNKNSSLKK